MGGFGWPVRIMVRFFYGWFVLAATFWLPSTISAVFTAKLTTSLTTRARMKNRDFHDEAESIVASFEQVLDEVRRLYDLYRRHPEGTSASDDKLIFTRRVFRG